MFYNGFTLYIVPNLYNILSPNTIMHLVFSAVLLGLQPHMVSTSRPKNMDISDDAVLTDYTDET